MIRAGDAYKRLLASWERTAAQLADAVVRDPRTLTFAARALKSQLLWRRALDTTVDAWWAAFLPVKGPAREQEGE